MITKLPKASLTTTTRQIPVTTAYVPYEVQKKLTNSTEYSVLIFQILF